jgi:hypothetical protein
VVGDSRNGVYNLRILNASLDDDAEYQCQVGPARFHKAIRANAQLSVICEYVYIQYSGYVVDLTFFFFIFGLSFLVYVHRSFDFHSL